MAASVHPLIRALEQYDALAASERGILEALPLQQREYAKDEEIVHEGDRPQQSCLLLDGFAARSQVLKDGSRQFTAIHIPGDFVDLHSLLLKKMDHSVIAFSACRVAFIAHEALRGVIDNHPHLARLLWVTTAVDAAIERAWITCIGRRSAPDHLAHFICETYMRMRGRGLTDDHSFPFPATQSELGDILGMSTVHVNRTLQDLRKLGLISWEGGTVTIHEYEQLARRAGFDPTYLSQSVEPR